MQFPVAVAQCAACPKRVTARVRSPHDAITAIGWFMLNAKTWLCPSHNPARTEFWAYQKGEE
jgi:hypothetical protein